MTAEPTRVLLVEDDENLRRTLADVLADEGYAVAQTASAEGAAELVGAAAFDLAILDVMLPDGDGYTLCQRLKGLRPALAVLMLTARTLEDDLVRGFDAGADDYLKKPYRLRELLVRVRALARRGGAPARAPALVIGGVRVDVEARSVKGEDGREIELTRTELDLLLFLVRHPARALTRDQILDAVWGRGIVIDERTVDNFVASLKKKLGLGGERPPRIVTVRGVGYRFELETG